MAMPWHKNPYFGVIKFTIFVDPSLVIITRYVVFLIEVKEERRFEKNNALFLYGMWSRLSTRIPDPRFMKCLNLVDPSLVIHPLIHTLSNQCPGVEKKIFKK